MRLFHAFALAGMLLLSTIIPAWAQEYEAVITLDALPSEVNAGDTIIFSGALVTSDGQYVIPGRTIYIKDDVAFGVDTILGSLVTDDNGEYSGSWIAELREGGGSYDFYVVFEGEENISEARSQTYSVYVEGSNEESFQTLPEYFPTEIELDPLPSSVYAGESITFTGTLTSDGDPVQNALIKIMEDDPALPDQILSSGYTEFDGTFSIPWQVSIDSLETDYDVYATFDGDDNFEYARSINQIISVLRFIGSISLDPLPLDAKIGNVLIFTGALELGQYSSEGAIVYIKDEDLANPDDLLATAFVNNDGTFSANWFVTEVDADLEADIYAVFEGNDLYYRLTTCDPNPTMDYGGSCDFTIPLGTYYDGEPDESPDEQSGYSGDEYMELFYTLDFSSEPIVAIIPSPDSYDKAYRFIGATQEGILMWTSYMEADYGGNWDVQFEVNSKGQSFASYSPDVVVNLVTPEEDAGCNRDYYGYAQVSPYPTKPIQIVVCAIEGRSSAEVAATAAHEFAHAVGLAHTWNKQGDMLCSSETIDGSLIYTCPNYHLGKSTSPSLLNVAAMARLYGGDGFTSPNNNVEFKSKFWLGQDEAEYSTDESPFQVTSTEIQPEPDPEPTSFEPEEGESAVNPSSNEEEQNTGSSNIPSNEIDNEEHQLSGSSSNSNTPSSGGGCLIATAAFGSELTPQVQFLRNFRDNHILSTAAGSSFMNVFNSWYYSFSPSVADYEREQPWLQQTVKAAIYPLLGILHISEKAYSTIPGEYGALSAGLVASAMIGAVYISPLALSIKKVRKSKLNYKLLACVTSAVLATVIGAIISGNETALMGSTAAFVLTVVGVSAILFARLLHRLTEIVSPNKLH